MSNSWFAFKQFSIHQDRCAMKISTDACIQGAWTPLHGGPMRVLDIGTGTGLLALMTAQRAPDAIIDALELDGDAAAQADENVRDSPFADRIQVHHTDAHAFRAPHLYDLIICNPPFFSNSLQGPDAARNRARHTGSLHPANLPHLLLEHLAPEGIASLLWPPREHERFREHAASCDLHLLSFLQVQDRAGSRITRVVGIYGRHAGAARLEELVIKDSDGSYTSAFIGLLSPFYLRL